MSVADHAILSYVREGRTMGTQVSLRSVGVVPLGDYLDFRAARPARERWNLIEGIAWMMPPPSVRHQRIVLNLLNILNAGLDRVRPDLVALTAVGLALPDRTDFRPEPDVAVVEAARDERVWSDRFFAAVEIASEGNTHDMLAAKARAYAGHPDCQHVLIVEQKEMAIVWLSRLQGFESVRLTAPGDVLSLPEFDVTTTLADVYRHIRF